MAGKELNDLAEETSEPAGAAWHLIEDSGVSKKVSHTNVVASHTAHAAGTTSVHGIADTSDLELQSNKSAVNGYASLDGSGTIPDAEIPATITRDSELTAHEADTTAIHGITDTATLTTAAAVVDNDAIVRGDGGARGVQNSGVAIDDSDNITGVNDLDVGNLTTTNDLQVDGDATFDNQVDQFYTPRRDVITVAASGSTETLEWGPVYEVTMDQNCTFSFSATNLSTGFESTMTLYLDGAFTPTWPAAVVWPNGVEPAYSTPSVYEFRTIDDGTTVYGFQGGAAFA